MNPDDGVRRTRSLLGAAPLDRELALVLRHGERGYVGSDGYGNDAPITCRGRTAARWLGRGLASIPPAALMTSPLVRCVQTANALIAGAGWGGPPVCDPRLGGPGPFVVEPDLAGPLFLDLGPRGVVERQLAGAEPPPGMRSTSDGVALLLDLIAPRNENRRGISVFVTHDVVLATLVGSLYGLNVDDFAWPDYLDGLVLWRDCDRLRFLWPGLGQGLYPIRR